MEIIRSKEALKDAIRWQRGEGKTIGLVPTMGALHAGHISLVGIAKHHAETIVVSIFVNPTQFGPDEDFSRYPRMETDDLGKLKSVGPALVYIPTVKEMYPKGGITRVSVSGISNELCGAFRPGHFDGVATIVTKLLMQVAPNIAVFGEKDYQQLHIIRKLTSDLDIPVDVIGAPIVREADGLAMSSRNRYLNENERVIAASLYTILDEAAVKIRTGEGSSMVMEKAREALLASGFAKVDYVELRDAATLAPVTFVKKPARLLAAAHIGTTRLIDNVPVNP